MRFRKISLQQMDCDRVTLSIVRARNGRLQGVVTTGRCLANETPEIITSLSVAAAIAKSAASYVGEDVDVVDEQGLWRPSIGELLAPDRATPN